MKKLLLTPEDLYVESFPTEAVRFEGRGTVAAYEVTRPECAKTVYDTCDC